MVSCGQLVTFVLLTTTLIPASIAGNADKLRSKRKIVLDGALTTKAMNLRLCNAFADKAPIGVVLKNDREKEVVLTQQEPLNYKSCKALSLELERGDTFEFQQGGAELGAFAVTSVPDLDDAILLLIIHRKGTSAQPAFVSHMFSRTKNAQVAVLDMYTGPSKHSLVIQEEKKLSPDQKGQHVSILSEQLAYDSVVAVGHGKYFCAFSGTSQESHALKASRVQFKADAGESYVAMRVGNAASPDFPEELVVFPKSGSHWIGLQSLTVIALLLSLSLLQ